MPYMARIDPFTSPTRHVSARMESLFRDSSPDLDPVKYEVDQKIRPIGDSMAVVPVMPQTSYRERYARMKQLDHDRDTFIEDLLRQVEIGQQQIQQLRLDYSNKKSYDEAKGRAHALQHEIDSMRTLLDRNSYMTCLIDGDLLMFRKEFMAHGEKGGLEAAQTLSRRLRTFCVENIPHLDAVNVHVKLFLNVRSVTDLLVRTKAIDKATTFESFLKGLISSNGTFDIVDTGLLRGLTTRKIKESYRHDLINVHCHQIFLAALASTDLSALLSETPDIPIHERVTVLEPKGLHANEKIAHEIQSLPFDQLLCKLPADEPWNTPALKAATPILARVESNSSSRTINSTQASATTTPILTWAAMTAQPFVPNPGENRSNTSTPLSTTKALASTKTTLVVNRNKHGQRVDAVDNSIPYQELQRIKKMKLCNIFYLQGKDACPGSCNHSHSYPLKSAEKNILKEVARMTPCHYRTDCDDPNCIYGHRCPQSKPDKKDCYYKDECRFYGWGHGIDEKVVKTHNIK